MIDCVGMDMLICITSKRAIWTPTKPPLRQPWRWGSRTLPSRNRPSSFWTICAAYPISSASEGRARSQATAPDGNVYVPSVPGTWSVLCSASDSLA